MQLTIFFFYQMRLISLSHIFFAREVSYPKDVNYDLLTIMLSFQVGPTFGQQMLHTHLLSEAKQTVKCMSLRVTFVKLFFWDTIALPHSYAECFARVVKTFCWKLHWFRFT